MSYTESAEIKIESTKQGTKKYEIGKYAIDKNENIGYITVIISDITDGDPGPELDRKYYRIRPLDLAANNVINDVTRYEDNKQALWDEIDRIKALPDEIDLDENDPRYSTELGVTKIANPEKLWHMITGWSMEG